MVYKKRRMTFLILLIRGKVANILSLTVEEVMQVDGVNQCKVVAGEKGLSNIVTFATIMEVPDIVKWLKGNEIIITSLYPIKDDEAAQEELIYKLYKVGVSALAIKPRRFVEEIPSIILSEAEKYHIPIIEIPEEISYLDILSPIMNTIFDNKNDISEGMDKTDQILNELSLASKGINNLIEVLTHLTEKTITVESLLPYIEVPEPDFTFKPLSEHQIKELSLVKRPIKIRREYGGRKVDGIVAPIFIDEELCGCLTSWGTSSTHTAVDLAVMEKAITVLTLEFLKMKVKYDVEQQYKNDFVRDLLLNEYIDIDEIKERGKKFNFFIYTSYVSFVIQINEHTENKLNKYNQIESVLHRYHEDLVTGYVNEYFCILYPLEDDVNDSTIQKIAYKFHDEIVNRLYPLIDFRFGIGRYYLGVKGLRKSFHEAKKSLSLSHPKNKVISYSDLGVYSLLGQIQNIDELQSFHDDTIGILVDYDSSSDLQLLNTLHCYFDNDEKLKRTADELFVHVNTLKYRIKRIEKLTNYSIQKSNEKLILHLGLKVHDLLSSDYQNR